MLGVIRASFLLCVSAGLHLGLLTLLPAGYGGGDGGGDAEAPEIRGADAELAALVALWDRPPDSGATAELAVPTQGDAADLAAAQAVLEAVEAGAATEALDDTRDPGPTPDRPIMVALPTPSTAPP